ncbi:MAG: DUF3617 domain-containing protein [Aquincola tertiaricarbonis]|uniref:DUF3617 domain-containing protein n=1 Tax=Aquincola sp. J276 TaxID=2898432 RepID=UPI002150F10A|nr:DUF3617 domain-containing protein [Aquincola sp. J276]MCR5867380.1 DUF3617 domain-containing protein [Aquincola sp. J276]
MKSFVTPALVALISWLAVGGAQAQTLSVKPGLWASASTTRLNGSNMPTLFDVNGAMTPEQRSSLTAAMSRLGLPAGSNLALHCQRSDSYRLPAPQALEGCQVKVSPTNATSGTIALSCSGKLQGSGRGSYEVTGRTAARQQLSMEATSRGLPLKLEQSTVFKWLGDDCERLPAGIDPEMFAVEEADDSKR